MKTVNYKLGLVAMFGVLLISGTAIAKGNETENGSNLVTSPEKELSIENWMVDGDFWNFTEAFLYTGSSREKNLNVEDWMTNDDYFSQTASAVDSATDGQLEIEGWIVNENHWENTVLNTTEEADFIIEDWMLDNNNWKK